MLRNCNQSSGGRRILGVPTVGILASQIISETATGDHGPGLLYDEALVNAGKQLRARITSLPSAGTLFVHENGSVDFSGSPDGIYYAGYAVDADTVEIKADVATFTVGVVSGNASAGTGTSTGSGTGGVATGQTGGSASADAGEGISSGSGSGGEATGESSSSASGDGGTGTSTGSGSGGDAAAGSGSSASIPSATGTSAGSGSGGSATGAGSGTYTRAPSGSGPSLIYPTSSRGIKPGRCRH